jgi:hypothetical protein
MGRSSVYKLPADDGVLGLVGRGGNGVKGEVGDAKGAS